jgi:hypothetical protein
MFKKLGGDAPLDAPGGFRMPHSTSSGGGANPAARSYFAKQAAARRTPEQRAAIAKRLSDANANRTPEQRSASAKKAAESRTPEDRAASAKKGAQARKEAARYHKASLERSKAEARSQARLEKKYGNDENGGDDSTKTADDEYRERIEERKKKIHDVIVPHDAKEKVFYNKARRDLIISFEEAGVRWVEDQQVIEAEARTQRETHYVERNSLLRHERDEMDRDNPDLSNPTNYRR